MRLNLQTDLALRTLTHLAVVDGQLVPASDVARVFDVSSHHLMKVAGALTREGFVESVRGRHGGLRLARPPEAISVGDVVRRIEPDFALVDCQRADGACLIAPGCRLPRLLSQATEAFLAVLDAATLADLVDANPILSDLLQQEPA